MMRRKLNAVGSRIRTGVAVLVLLAMPSIALAQGFYAGASYGWLNTDDSDFTDDTANGWRIFFGATANRIIGWEIGYADLGSYGGGPVLGDVDINAWDASLIAGLPVGPVTLFGRVGAVYADIKTANRSSDTDWTYKYGLGAEFNIGKKAALRFEWDRYPIDSGVLDADVDTASVALLFRFGT
ncbi:MAG: porin family protein [Sulfurifustis sp.]